MQDTNTCFRMMLENQPPEFFGQISEQTRSANKKPKEYVWYNFICLHWLKNLQITFWAFPKLICLKYVTGKTVSELPRGNPVACYTWQLFSNYSILETHLEGLLHSHASVWFSWSGIEPRNLGIDFSSKSLEDANAAGWGNTLQEPRHWVVEVFSI